MWSVDPLGLLVERGKASNCELYARYKAPIIGRRGWFQVRGVRDKGCAISGKRREVRNNPGAAVTRFVFPETASCSLPSVGPLVVREKGGGKERARGGEGGWWSFCFCGRRLEGKEG